MSKDIDREDLLQAAVLDSLERVKKLGYTVLFVANYGSHNYNLDIDDEDYVSDVDTKAIILPTLRDLVNNSKPISTTLVTRAGQCDVKDIRAFVPTLLKANVQFLETLQAQTCWINPDYEKEFNWFIDHLEELIAGSKPQLLKSIYGMCLEKRKAMTHPFPSIKWKIDEWGYDGKQVHHILRLSDILTRYFEFNKSFEDSIWYDTDDIRRWFLIQVKKNEFPLEQALKVADEKCEKIKNKVEFLLESAEKDENFDIKKQYESQAKKIIINNIKKEILEGENVFNSNTQLQQ